MDKQKRQIVVKNPIHQKQLEIIKELANVFGQLATDAGIKNQINQKKKKALQ